MSPTLDTCNEILADFATERDGHSPDLLGIAEPKHPPYRLDGAQVGALVLLLWKANKLEAENAALKQTLGEAQQLVDHSIAYLGSEV